MQGIQFIVVRLIKLNQQKSLQILALCMLNCRDIKNGKMKRKLIINLSSNSLVKRLGKICLCNNITNILCVTK